MGVPESERDQKAGGERLVSDGRNLYKTVPYINKEFLAQLVIDGQFESKGGKNAGKIIGDMIADSGLASKFPKGRR